VLTSIPNYPAGKYYEGYGVFSKRKERFKGINIIRIPVIPRGSGSSLMLSLSYLSYVFSGLIYSFTFIRKKYDLIFVFEPSPITVAIPAIAIKKFLKLPLCIWVLDLWPESVSAAGNLKSDLIPRLLLPIVKFIYKQSDLIMVSSMGFIDSIKKKGVEESKIKYFPQWSEEIFESKLVNHSSKHKDKIPNGFVIMFAGNIGEAQDFPAVVKAAVQLKDYKDIHWVILGNGSRMEWLRNSIIENDLGDNFHILGQFPIEDVPEFYSYADSLLISLKREEIFSLTVPAKLQTYLASRKPILSMLDGEASRIIDEAEAGFTAESGDYVNLSKNVLKMRNLSKDQIMNMGNNSYLYFEDHFKSKKLLNEAEQIFKNMIRKGSQNNSTD
tara:strand:+ start:634 stop:1785 length:1152 start_codon:yes stop_codon:yes gene_type:complete